MRCGSAQATAERGFEDGKILDGERTIENHIYLVPEKEREGGGGMRRSTKAVQQAMRVRSREASER